MRYYWDRKWTIMCDQPELYWSFTVSKSFCRRISFQRIEPLNIAQKRGIISHFHMAMMKNRNGHKDGTLEKNARNKPFSFYAFW